MSNIYYCYSKPQKEFIESFGISCLDEVNLFHSRTNKQYWRFNRGYELDIALNRWKQNKIEAINYIKTIKKIV
jgi:hypothetical protein